MSEKTKSKPRKSVYRQGYVVALLLAVLTVIEYYAAHFTSSAIVMFLLAIFKGALVLNYFMHISSVWSSEEEH